MEPLQLRCADRNLVELPAEKRKGFVWIVENPAGSIDVGAHLGVEMDEVLRGYQPKTTKINATARVFTEDRRWEVALIGRNLTNKFVVQDAFSTFDSGQIATGFTGTASGYAGDIGGTVMRGREVRLQLNVKM